MFRHPRLRMLLPTVLPVLLGTGLIATAQAEPAFARMYRQQYGYPPSCNACHKDGGGTPLNPYGRQFKDAGMAMEGFGKIAGFDADGDGVANGEEATAKANPGDADSTPDHPTAWLDTASLIPREVQAAFPGVRAYLPKDALLTEADIARAHAMGAELGADDANTIYIPLENQRPVGTALIFPASWHKKLFFLLLVTDRRLVVTQVSPINTRHVPDAASRTIYGSFSGIPLDKLRAADGDGLDAAITRAVKNAGTLVYVRLKGN